jgi:hypothetical protein
MTNAITAFNHILDNVLLCDDQSPLKNALVMDGYLDIFCLMTIEEKVISELEYSSKVKEEDKECIVTHPVQKGDKGLLRMFLHFVEYQNNTENPIS